MKPLARAGSSTNITWYEEEGRQDFPAHIYAEVLRADFGRIDGKMAALDPPVFHLRITRTGQGEVATRKYRPALPVPPGPLDATVVTRLVRDALKGT